MEFKNWINNRESQKELGKKSEWRATKDQIIDFWKTLRIDSPIQMAPISYDHKGSTYGEDGIRITGRPEFIASVLGKLKNILAYEAESTKLVVSYRETQSPSQVEAGNLKKSYVFYVQTRQRNQ
jgi:hypothetical protein